MVKYLKGKVHWLSITEAISLRNTKGEWCEIWMENDGTWSAAELTDKPVQHGQTPWVGSKKITIPR